MQEQFTPQEESGKKNKKKKEKLTLNTWEERYGKNKGKKKSKKGLIIGLSLCAVVVILVVWGFLKTRAAVASVKDSLGSGVVVEEFGEKDMSTYIDTIGVVESQNVDNVYTTLTYPVKEINVKVGDRVKAGDVLCTIDTEAIQEKITALESQATDQERSQAKQIEAANHQLNSTRSANSRSVNKASKSVAEAKEDFDEADTNYYKKLDAYNKAWKDAEEVATSTDAIEANPKVKAAKTELDAADSDWYLKEDAYDAAVDTYNDTVASTSESNINAKDSNDLTIINNTSYSSLAAELASYYKMKNDSVIIAETSGIVTSISATEGVPANGVLMTIQDDKNLEVNVDIKEKDIFSVKEGMSVEFANSSLTNVSGQGKIEKINNFAVPSTSAAANGANGATAVADNSFGAKLIVTESKDMLLGMKIKARIATGEELRTDAVPYTAILTSVEGDYVYVAEEAGNGMYMVVKKFVEKGMSGDYYTQIEGGDLEKGDLVIAYPSTVTENSIITIQSDDKTDKDENAENSGSDNKDDKKDSDKEE